MRNIIYLYNRGSEGGKLLASKLNLRRAKEVGSPFHVDTLINWGASSVPSRLVADKILNHPMAVSKASNKLSAFIAMQSYGVSIPRFCESYEVACEMLDEGHVVCRTILNGHSGAGIVIANTESELVDAPLYTQYIKKNEEYRVHVVNGEVIHKQRKARSRDVPDDQVNWAVRNHSNGFIFQIQDFEIPDVCLSESIKAVAALNLTFGAVDVIYNNRTGVAHVLEVNTAPGLTDTTADKYAEVLGELL